MNVRILKATGSDSAVANTVSNMMLNNYKKGLAIANHEMEEENGISDSVGVVDPTETVRMGKQKDVAMGGPAFSKGYKSKGNLSADVPNTGISASAGSKEAKEFVIQSKVLDNELDHVISHLRVTNADEFYKSGQTGSVDPAYQLKIEKTSRDLHDRLLPLEDMHDYAKQEHNDYVHGENEKNKFESEIKQHKQKITDLVDEYNLNALPPVKRKLTEEERKERDAIIAERKRINAEKTAAEKELRKKKTEYENLMQIHGQRNAPVEQDIIELEEHIQELTDMLNYLPNSDTAVNDLHSKGVTVDRKRFHTKYDQGKFYPLAEKEYDSTMQGSNSHLKSKNGVRVVDGIPIAKFTQETIDAIKKISNLITTTVLPLAQRLYEKRFAGITLQDKNTLIPQLYKDLDDKMYILTSMNNQKVTSLIKLDKDFDKLYDIVKNGLNMYVMPTGGSMTGGHIRNFTNHLYEL